MRLPDLVLQAIRCEDLDNAEQVIFSLSLVWKSILVVFKFHSLRRLELSAVRRCDVEGFM